MYLEEQNTDNAQEANHTVQKGAMFGYTDSLRPLVNPNDMDEMSSSLDIGTSGRTEAIPPAPATAPRRRGRPRVSVLRNDTTVEVRMP